MDPASRPPVIERLKQRKLFQWTVAYLSGAWFVLQFVDVVGDQFDWPAVLGRSITVLLAVGFLAVVVIAWYHGEKGRQRVTGMELLVLSLLLVLAGIGIGLVRRQIASTDASAVESAELPLDPGAIAVIPFGPAVPDPVLTRLGRDLVVTLSATLDRLGDLRTVDALTVLARTAGSERALSLPDAVAFARRLGVGHLLHGGLAREGADVRLDVVLYRTEDVEPLARASLTAPADDVSGITDSLTFALVRQLWREELPAVPGVAAITTSSVPALRAYLEGEHALASGEFDAAVAAFERAFAADTTFWFAFWRSLYPRAYEGSLADSASLAKLWLNRSSLPDQDRLLIEARAEPHQPRRLELLEQVTRRFQSYLPAWYTYANELVHWTPPLGTTLDQSRLALDRVVFLNPGFAPGWEHLFWVSVLQHDEAAAAGALQRMHDFIRPTGFRFNPELISYYGTVLAALGNEGELPSDSVPSVAATVMGMRDVMPHQSLATGLIWYDIPAAQIQLNRAILEQRPEGPFAAVQWLGIALGWARRGAWDSTLVAMDRHAQMAATPRSAVLRYGLAVTGAVLAAVPPEEAASRRPSPETLSRADAELVAQAAWLDGVLGSARGSVPAVRSAAERVATSGSRNAATLLASLGAFERYATGDRAGAAARLAALEDSIAAQAGYGRFADTHPFLTAVHRLVSAEWLLLEGDTATAARMLAWHEGVLPGGPLMLAVSRTVGGVALYHRARIAESLGRADDANRLYRRFLDRFDAPVPALRPLSDSARSGLVRTTRMPIG